MSDYATLQKLVDKIVHEETKDVFCPSKNRSDYRIETSFQRPDALRYGQAQHSKIDMSIGGVHYSRSDDGPWDSYVGGIFLQDCNGMPIVHDSKLYFDADMVIATGKMKIFGPSSGPCWKCHGFQDSADKAMSLAITLHLLALFMVVFPSADLSAAAGNPFLGRHQSGRDDGSPYADKEKYQHSKCHVYW